MKHISEALTELFKKLEILKQQKGKNAKTKVTKCLEQRQKRI